MPTSDELPTFFAELTAWAGEGPVAAASHAYGAAPDQHADLRLPAGPGPHPVLVVVHGGFWQAPYTKDNTTALAVTLAKAGWASWNVEYRRVGAGGGYPQTLEDVAAACQALRHADASLDLGTVVAIGHSAGGQLALWLAAERLVHAAVGLAAVSDLTDGARARLGQGAVAGFLGGPPDTVPHAYADADPARRLPLGVPALLVHGTEDDRVPLRQSRDFAAAARAAGTDCELLELAGADHFDVIDPRTAWWPSILAALARLRAAIT